MKDKIKLFEFKENNNRTFASFELKEPYYTTRCIDGQLYVFSKGYLRESNKKIERTYIEDSKTKEISLNQIKFIKDDPSMIQTLIAEVNLNAPRDVRVNSFLMDISNAYVSKNNIYLLNDDYDTDRVKISSLFSWKGVIGFFESLDYNYEPKTKIYKFEMHKSKGVVLKNTAKVDGSIVNQFSAPTINLKPLLYILWFICSISSLKCNISEVSN